MNGFISRRAQNKDFRLHFPVFPGFASDPSRSLPLFRRLALGLAAGLISALQSLDTPCFNILVLLLPPYITTIAIPTAIIRTTVIVITAAIVIAIVVTTVTVILIIQPR